MRGDGSLESRALALAFGFGGGVHSDREVGDLGGVRYRPALTHDQPWKPFNVNCSARKRQLHGEHRSMSDLAPHLHAALMCFHKCLHNGQTEPRSLMLT